MNAWLPLAVPPAPRRRPLLVSWLVLLFAGSAGAAPIVYDLSGSEMVMVNQACNPCSVAVTGTLTLDDDGLGNVLLTDLALAHAPYEVGTPGFLSVVLERTDIGLGAGAVAGSGSTLLDTVAFSATTLAQTGTLTCTSGLFGCFAFAGVLDGTHPLVATLPGIALGLWSFDALGDLTASFVYTDDVDATETLNLVGTPTAIPEPGTAILIAAGLVGMALRRPRCGRR